MTRQGLFLLDLIKQTSVQKKLQFLKDSQTWSKDQLMKLQKEKLNNLLYNAIQNVPYYRQKEKLVQSEINKLNAWSVLDRRAAMDAGGLLLSEKAKLNKCKVSRTGGTTGPPLRLYRDTETRSWALAAYYRFYEWMGIEPGMSEVELWGSTVIRGQKAEGKRQKSLQTRMFNKLNNFKGFDAFSFNDQYLESVVSEMQRFKPKLIRGYLSAILLLADHIKRNNINGITPLAVSTTAETLFPEYRKKIEDIFQAPLFNQYGCGECNSIAFECKEHNGMHITMEHCILESDVNNQLIVTNLDNHSQPFIRYNTGDLGIITDQPCLCGYAGPRLTELSGRINENIILKDGSSVNGIFFANLLDQSGFINDDKMLRFQVIQDTKGEIKFKAEVVKDLNGPSLNKLMDSFMPYFENVEISQHRHLQPGPTGKFQYLISNIKMS